MEIKKEAFEAHNCPKRNSHVSAWPAYDRELCPYCQKVYIRDPRYEHLEEANKYLDGAEQHG